jgi:phenylalanyl-tRNA synthetase alpha chain
MNIKEEIKSIDLEKIKKEINQLQDLESISNLSHSLIGRKGKINLLLKQIKDLPYEEKKSIGELLNSIKEELEEIFNRRKSELVRLDLEKRLKEERIDVTMSKAQATLQEGHLHPITLVLREVIELFTSMGFEVVEGPEIENEYYNFEALNVPKDHPARDMWNTYTLKSNLILRTHTSSMQIRYMEKNKPPIKIIVPGKCYRYEAVDATHLDVFNQLEGLVVDKNIHFSDLKGTLKECVGKLLGEDLKVRFRPAYYPFVEPGADLDVECIFCYGKGCNVCKFSGWIELIPCGMVHPQVFRNVGYDSEEITGFAFGMGFDRLVMLKFGINDLRLLYQGDLRVLTQF